MYIKRVFGKIAEIKTISCIVYMTFKTPYVYLLRKLALSVTVKYRAKSSDFN